MQAMVSFLQLEQFNFFLIRLIIICWFVRRQNPSDDVSQINACKTAFIYYIPAGKNADENMCEWLLAVDVSPIKADFDRVALVESSAVRIF